MASLTFELAFDWNMPRSENQVGVILPLQMCLVHNDLQTVVSSCHSGAINTGDTLDFRIYDFTDPLVPAPLSSQPRTLQVLFTTADDGQVQSDPPISPILFNNEELPLLSTTNFPAQGVPSSIAYGSTARSWDVVTDPASPLVIERSGRFEVRAALTLALPGEIARVYRIDPEMVVGGGGTGP